MPTIQQSRGGRGRRPQEMMDYLQHTDRKRVSTRQLLGTLSANKILLYAPLLQWYIDNGLEVTAVYRTIDYESKKSSSCSSSKLQPQDAKKMRKIPRPYWRMYSNCWHSATHRSAGASNQRHLHQRQKYRRPSHEKCVV